jgi:glycosyltransferase involved in cell wall biosynthesis
MTDDLIFAGLSEKAPKVSVCVITYNQEKCIRQCLQSIIEQVTDFKFEVIVGDDCSTDKTRDIVEEFAERYPGIIKPIYQTRNIGGGSNNFVTVHKAARGQFVAHIDGDDIAFSGKLQKQADALDKNPHCSFVVHKTAIFDNHSHSIIGTHPSGRRKSISTIEELVRDYLFFSHSSKMYRRGVDDFNATSPSDVIDFYFHILHASRGPILYLEEVLGAYRSNQAGSITQGSVTKISKLFALTLDAYELALRLKVNREIVEQGRSNWLYGAMMHFYGMNELLCMRNYHDLWLASQLRLGRRHNIRRILLQGNTYTLEIYVALQFKVRKIVGYIRNRIIFRKKITQKIVHYLGKPL